MPSSKKVSSGGSASVNTEGLRQLQKSLNKESKAMGKQLVVGLKKAGAIAQAQAQKNASWSSKIPGSIKVRASSRSIVIYSRLGEAISWETTGQHQVFGHNRWAKHPYSRPFMAPAAVSTAQQVAEAIGDAIENAIKDN